VTLDLDNLFDRLYCTSAYSPLWLALGGPRSLMLGVQSRF
jgi:outer membrane receptor for ferric coprogen and ferric-rhodotorulic acid